MDGIISHDCLVTNAPAMLVKAVAGGQSSVLSAAHEYLRRGFSVIPVKREKTPALRDWKQYQEQCATEEEARGWFGGYGVAIVLGDVSGGLGVRDFDVEGSYASWAADNAQAAQRLPTVVTGRPGGHHVYFRLAPGVLTEIRAGREKPGNGAINLGDGELRADVGCYVVAPPSIHPTGVPYRWLIPLAEEIPVIDPRTAGLLRDWTPTHPTEGTEVIISVSSVPSTSSVSSVVSVRSVEEEAIPSASSVEMDGSVAMLVDAAIRKTQPERTGQRHNCEFQLARELRAIPGLAARSIDDLKPYVRRWYDRALLIIGTKEWETIWWEFKAAWEDVQFPAGELVADQCLEMAMRADPPECAAKYESKRVRLLVGLCYQLQKAKGALPFFLSCRTAGRLMGVDEKTANLWLRGLCADEVLKVVEKPPRGSLRAIRYQFIGKA